MNKIELIEWTKSAEYVTCSFFEYDKCGNKECSHVYKKDNKFYQIHYLNDEPLPVWLEGQGYVYDEFELEPVQRVVQMVEKVTYEPMCVSGNEDI